MQRCEMCGKKIRDYKMFSPKGMLDMIFVCKECHEQGRAAEWGEVSAVNYFTKQIDTSKATEKGKKCINQCLSNAKETIENKMETNKIQREEKEEENEQLEKFIVTSTDTIVGHDELLYFSPVCNQGVVPNGPNMDLMGCVYKLIDELKRACNNSYIHGIVGLKINTMLDYQGNIAVFIYGTPVIFLDTLEKIKDEDEEWDEEYEDDSDEEEDDFEEEDDSDDDAEDADED